MLAPICDILGQGRAREGIPCYRGAIGGTVREKPPSVRSERKHDLHLVLGQIDPVWG